jgi:hypothetical protein
MPETFKKVAAYAVDADSSRFWKTPEVAILSCPFDTFFCGDKKVVTLTDGVDTTLNLKGIFKVNARKGYCNWIVKSTCKPITLAYDMTGSDVLNLKPESSFEVSWV